MNQCSIYKNRFSEYVDQELTDQLRQDFLRHLSGCTECSEDFNSFERAHSALEILAAPLPSRPVLASVRARIRQEEEARSKRKPWVWLPAPALGAAVIAVVAFGLWRPTDVRIADSNSGPVNTIAVQPHARLSDQTAVDTLKSPVVPLPSIVTKSGPVVAGISETSHFDSVRRPRRNVNPALRVAAHANTETIRSVAPASPAVHTKKRPAYVMVAYYPTADYSVKFEDQSTGQKGEIAVKTSLAENGAIESATLKYHLSAAGNAVEDNDSQDTHNEDRTDNGGGVPGFALPV